MSNEIPDVARCFCCGDYLGPRQLYRHLAGYQQRLELFLAQANPETEEDKNDENKGEETGGEFGNNGPIQPVIDHDIQVEEPTINLPDPEPELLPPAYGIRRNPRVTIEDWPEPDLDSNTSDDEEDINITSPVPLPDLDRDPEFVERQEPLGLDSNDEPEYSDQEMRQILRDIYGDIADEQWGNMYLPTIEREDYLTLQFLATRLRTHFSRQTYEDLRHGACEDLKLPSEFVAWRRLRILSGLESCSYDCCINSCCCFLGKYQDLEKCPFCNANRYAADGRVRRVFRYTPLIPQLQALYLNSKTASNILYRTRAEKAHDPNVVQDVFDGANYRLLREKQLSPGSEYRIFDHPNDLALGLSTDGFTLFKRRRRGHSTAWPIILINYNLHPSIRTRLENVLCVGVIPGPTQAKDLNSFLIPLLDELLQLEAGIPSSAVMPQGNEEDVSQGVGECEGAGRDAGEGEGMDVDEGAGVNVDGGRAAHEHEHEHDGEVIGYNFVLRAFLIVVFGDIPAIAKLMCMKGHNSLTPCRTCYIQGVLCRLRKNSVYYVPLMHPDDNVPIQQLHMRTHELFIRHLAELDLARQRTQVEFNRLSMDYGIKGRSVFTHLKSINLATSFPYDIMHLLFENLVPNMIRHWTGTFKGLDEGTGTHKIPKPQWEGTGRMTKQATKTIPTSFVGTLQDIAQDLTLYKAEAFAFWIQYLAPILLRGILPNRYYQHLLLLREIILRCLQFEITHAEIDELQNMLNKWVADYEKYYYQYRASRLPTCPLTIHALLHIPYYMRQTGPLWASWAFVMERFCGHLLPAVKNRIRPYDHLDNFVQRRAQMQIVSKVYDLPSIARPLVHYTYENGERISSHERMYPEFPDFVLGTPVISNSVPDNQLLRQLGVYFTLFRPGLNGARLLDRITRGQFISHGRIRMAGEGDNIRIASIVARTANARDNSFIKYDIVPDANAAWRNRRDDRFRQTRYGQLLNIYYVQLPEDDNVTFTSYLLLRVKSYDTGGRDATKPETPVVTFTENDGETPEIINALTLIAVVGRVRMGNTWAIVDRSRGNARTQFLDDEGNVELEA